MSKLLIKTFPVGLLVANCYIVIDQDSDQCLIIDPGDDAQYLIQQINDLQIIPSQIIATHGHFDHIMAAYELQTAFNIPFLISSKDEFLVNNLNKSAKEFIGIEAGPPPKISQHLNQLDKISLPNHSFKLLQTPGHTPGSISLYIPESQAVFVGDVIFAEGGIGRYDFSYCDYNDLLKSIKLLLSLPKETTIYSGHGAITTIEKEYKFHRQ